MKHTIASLEQHPRKHDEWRAVAGSTVVSAWNSKETARRVAACWNACVDIPTDKLEVLAVAKILVEQKKV